MLRAIVEKVLFPFLALWYIFTMKVKTRDKNLEKYEETQRKNFIEGFIENPNLCKTDPASYSLHIMAQEGYYPEELIIIARVVFAIYGPFNEQLEATYESDENGGIIIKLIKTPPGYVRISTEFGVSKEFYLGGPHVSCDGLSKIGQA